MGALGVGGGGGGAAATAAGSGRKLRRRRLARRGGWCWCCCCCGAAASLRQDHQARVCGGGGRRRGEEGGGQEAGSPGVSRARVMRGVPTEGNKRVRSLPRFSLRRGAHAFVGSLVGLEKRSRREGSCVMSAKRKRMGMDGVARRVGAGKAISTFFSSGAGGGCDGRCERFRVPPCTSPRRMIASLFFFTLCVSSFVGFESLSSLYLSLA